MKEEPEDDDEEAQREPSSSSSTSATTATATFVKTKFGNNILSIDGFRFRKTSTHGTKSYWSCTAARAADKLACKARCILDGDGDDTQLQITGSPHNHKAAEVTTRRPRRKPSSKTESESEPVPNPFPPQNSDSRNLDHFDSESDAGVGVAPAKMDPLHQQGSAETAPMTAAQFAEFFVDEFVETGDDSLPENRIEISDGFGFGFSPPTPAPAPAKTPKNSLADELDDNESVGFVKNSRGNNFLTHEGYRFRKRSENGTTTYWSCTEDIRHGCRAKIILTAGGKIQTKETHNHEFILPKSERSSSASAVGSQNMMTCLLCSSSSSSRGQGQGQEVKSVSKTRTTTTTSIKSLLEMDTLAGRMFAQSLCQLLGLPATRFEVKFLESAIGFCAGCTQVISRVSCLFDQLKNLEQQISEVRSQVKRRLNQCIVDNHGDKANAGASEILRKEILRESPPSPEDLDPLPVSPEGEVPEPEVSDFIVADEVIIKEEPEDLDEILGIQSEWTGSAADSDEIPPRKFCPPLGVGGVGSRLGRVVVVNPRSRRRLAGIPCSFAECPRTFQSLRTRRIHLEKIHSVPKEIPKTHRCPQPHCPKKFSNKRVFELHMRSHGSSSKIPGNQSKAPPFTCEKCLKIFNCAAHLGSHLRTAHIELRPFACPHCPKAFPRRNNLTSHLRRHAQVRNFLCEICSQTFYDGSDLANHKTKFHSNFDPDSHPFKCRFCARILSSQKVKKIHENRHEGGGALQCHVCAYRCDLPSRLAAHLKSHSEEREHKCGECEKAFKYKDKLKEHLRTHSGERPYECPKCPEGPKCPARKKFKLRSQLRAHFAKKHPGTELDVPHLPKDGFLARSTL